ncbi:MAG: DegV family protein [Anaerolineaceae bacterium]
MQIVTDRGMDLSPQQLAELALHFVPLQIILDGKSYSSGEDLQPEEFYRMLEQTSSYPTTSQPSVEEVARLYRKLAETDTEILSIHISSGLSGTINTARAAAASVPEANITIVDSLSLSAPFGWQVEAAAKALKAGWSREKIVAMLERLRTETRGVFTLATMKYLIHGGRISHLKGLLASMLNIKPVIAVETDHGTYVEMGKEMTLKRAIQKIVDLLESWYPAGTKLRVQPLHGDNLEGVEILCQRLLQAFNIHWEPVTTIGPVLGAHTGSSLVGLAVAPLAIFEDLSTL